MLPMGTVFSFNLKCESFPTVKTVGKKDGVSIEYHYYLLVFIFYLIEHIVSASTSAPSGN